MVTSAAYFCNEFVKPAIEAGPFPALPTGALLGAGPGQGFSLTPFSNTGLICEDPDLFSRIDWLTFIVPVADSSTVYSLLQDIATQYKDSVEYSWERGQFIGRQFANRANSTHGICSQWNLPGENDDPGSLRISLSGGLLERCDVADTVRLIHRLAHIHGAKFNRIDLAVDDYSRAMLPEYIREANKAGNYTGYRNFIYMTDDKGDCHSAGWTIYLGSRESDRYIRYYNAKFKHGIDAFRYEVEYKGELANVIANAIANTIAKDNAKYNSSAIAKTKVDATLSSMICELIVGNISFIDRASGYRASRSAPLPFWHDFVTRMGGKGVRLSPPTVKPTMERAISWLERSVAGTLAMVSEYVGADKIAYIRSLAAAGRERMGARHTSMLKAAKLEPTREYPIENGFVYEMV
jgi:hypothetical protein